MQYILVIASWLFCFKQYIVVVQSLSHVQLFVTPWIAALQASLSFTISQSLLKLMSLESVMPSNQCSFVGKWLCSYEDLKDDTFFPMKTLYSFQIPSSVSPRVGQTYLPLACMPQTSRCQLGCSAEVRARVRIRHQALESLEAGVGLEGLREELEAWRATSSGWFNIWALFTVARDVFIVREVTNAEDILTEPWLVGLGTYL